MLITERDRLYVTRTLARGTDNLGPLGLLSPKRAADSQGSVPRPGNPSVRGARCQSAMACCLP